MSTQEFFLAFGIMSAFLAVRFALPAAVMALFCACDRRFLHPQL